MSLSRFVEPLDLRTVRTNLGVLAQLLGFMLVPPTLVGFATREFLYGGMFAGLTLAVWGLGRLAAQGRTPDIRTKEALVVTALAYVMFAVVGAVSFLPVAPFLDGLFEAMSGFTTTGLTVMPVEELPWTLLFFRSYAQWIGGIGIIVLSLVVLLGPGRAGFRLYAAEFGQENIAGSVVATARVVLKVYLLITALAIVLLLAVGMPPVDAALHGLTTVSTGGFSPHADGIAHFTSPAVRSALVLLMLLGAVSFPLYYLAVSRGPRGLFKDLQLRFLLLITAVGSGLFFLSDALTAEAVLPSIFHATSALTGTGFQLTNLTDWSAPAFLVGFVLMAIGGSVGSTTGGIKLLRFIVVSRFFHWLMLKRMLPPEATVPLRYGRVVIGDEELREIFGFIALYVGLLLLSALALSFTGIPAADALFEAGSALGTVGLSSGITGPDLASGAKLMLILDMWAGRLEILPLLVLISQIGGICRVRFKGGAA